MEGQVWVVGWEGVLRICLKRLDTTQSPLQYCSIDPLKVQELTHSRTNNPEQMTNNALSLIIRLLLFEEFNRFPRRN
jgi:hypothetical protein